MAIPCNTIFCYLSVDRHLNLLNILTIVNMVSAKTHIFLNRYIFISFRYILRNRITGRTHLATLELTFLGIAKLFPEWVHTFPFPTAKCESATCSTSSCFCLSNYSPKWLFKMLFICIFLMTHGKICSYVDFHLHDFFFLRTLSLNSLPISILFFFSCLVQKFIYIFWMLQT